MHSVYTRSAKKEGDHLKKLYKSECYCTNMRRSAKAISDIYTSKLSCVGLTVAQYYLLNNLKRMGSANMTHWSECVGLDRSTIIRNSKNLLDKDLIKETDGHGRTFELSEKGKSITEQAEKIWHAIQREIEGVLGKDDTEALIRISDKLQKMHAGF